MATIKLMPCLISNRDCGGGTQVHHLTDGGRKMGHLWSIPLCNDHHHWNSPLPVGHAYGKGTKAWVDNHGCQREMLRQLRERMGLGYTLPPTRRERRYL